MADPSTEPVATLHDDGCFTWKRDEFRRLIDYGSAVRSDAGVKPGLTSASHAAAPAAGEAVALRAALLMARNMIATERTSFADCNMRPELTPGDDPDNFISIDGALFEQHDADVVADYDRALAQIDAALAAPAAPAEPAPQPPDAFAWYALDDDPDHGPSIDFYPERPKNRGDALPLFREAPAPQPERIAQLERDLLCAREDVKKWRALSEAQMKVLEMVSAPAPQPEPVNAQMLEALRHIEGAAMDITCERRTIRDAARAAITAAEAAQPETDLDPMPGGHRDITDDDPGPQPEPAAVPVAYAVYWGLPANRLNSVHIERTTAESVAERIKSATVIVPLTHPNPQPAPAVVVDFEAWNEDRYRDPRDIAIARDAFLSGLASRPGAPAGVVEALQQCRDALAPFARAGQYRHLREGMAACVSDHEAQAVVAAFASAPAALAAADAALPAPQPVQAVPMTGAASDVLAERRRQVEAEGWTPEHDDEHSDAGMAIAAAVYCLIDARPHTGLGIDAMRLTYHMNHMRWHGGWLKRSGPRRNLVKAGALILAEIERLDRAARAAGTDTAGGV